MNKPKCIYIAQSFDEAISEAKKVMPGELIKATIQGNKGKVFFLGCDPFYFEIKPLNK